MDTNALLPFGGLPSVRQSWDSPSAHSRFGGLVGLIRKRAGKAGKKWVPDGPDRLKNQPSELTYRILEFLPAEALCKLGECAKYLWHMTNDETLWRELCRHKYSELKHHPFTLHPAGVYDCPTLLQQMTVSDCKAVLTRRGVASRKWEHLCRSREQDDELDVLRQMVMESEGKTIPTPPEITGVTFISKWKSSYAGALMDLKRTKITKHELTSFSWAYFSSFDWSSSQANSSPPWVTFSEDGYRIGTKGYPRTQKWVLTDRGDIRVSSFPTHQTQRDPVTGGWVFGNGYVTYKSICDLWAEQGRKDVSSSTVTIQRWYDWDE